MINIFSIVLDVSNLNIGSRFVSLMYNAWIPITCQW